MATYTLNATATGIWDSSRPTTPVSSEVTAKMTPRQMLFKFGSVPSGMIYKKIIKITPSFWLASGERNGQVGYVRGNYEPMIEAWDPATLTANNVPKRLFDPSWETPWVHNASGETVAGRYFYDVQKYYSAAQRDRVPVLDVLNYGLRFIPESQSPTDGWQIATHLSAYKPTLLVEYGDTVAMVPGSMSPTGYIPKNTDCTFRWNVQASGVCPGSLTVASTIFSWRPAGGSWTNVSVGTAKSYTLAGSNITADSIEWKVAVTDSNGTTTTSAVQTNSTVEELSQAVAISPKNTMVDGSKRNLFTWEHIIGTGTAPTKSQLQCSSDGGSTWTQIMSVSLPVLQGNVSANVLPAGEILWRVRTFNTENNAGSWSEPVPITVVAAPGTPAVSAEQTPRPLISWQVTGQQGFQIRIAGVWESGSVYGTQTNFKLPIILPDGDYTVEVRVVNEYGLWSEWGSAPISVSHIGGASITLTAMSIGEIYLSWTTNGSYARFLVERDGVPVALTEEPNWVDYRAVGEHRYRVLGLNDSDDYRESNEIIVTLTVEINSVTDLLTGERLDMPYSTTQIQEEQITISHAVELTHFAGAAYPIAEVGEARDRAVEFEAAFLHQTEGKRLEALVGRLVCLKSKNNESVVGVLRQLKKTSSVFWIDYVGEVSQVDDREEVEL